MSDEPWMKAKTVSSHLPVLRLGVELAPQRCPPSSSMSRSAGRPVGVCSQSCSTLSSRGVPDVVFLTTPHGRRARASGGAPV